MPLKIQNVNSIWTVNSICRLNYLNHNSLSNIFLIDYFLSAFHLSGTHKKQTSNTEDTQRYLIHWMIKAEKI